METKKSEFNPFERVLVRDNDNERWQAAFYDQYLTNNDVSPHRVIGEGYFSQCIPYEGNEHLLGTTDSPVVPGQWKPKNSEMYYCIAWFRIKRILHGKVPHWNSHEPFDTDAWEAGNCFHTEEDAQQVIDRMNEALEGILSRVPGRLFDREQP